MDPVDIAPEFIDVEFEEIAPDDSRFAGYIAESAGEETFGISWPSWLPKFPESEWHAQKDRQKAALGTDRPGRLYLDPENDQSPESSCVFNAGECLYRYQWNKAVGKKFALKWSPMWGYQFNCSGRHSGSYTMDCLRWTSEIGLCPESSSNRSDTPALQLKHDRAKALCPHTYHQNTPYEGKKRYEEAKATAKWFRGRTWITLNGDIEFASALLHQLPICNGRSGHSIAHCDLVWDGRNWLSEYLDSYDSDRGDNGRLYDSRRMWSTSGAWALYDIYLPDNPLYPCGNETLEVNKETYIELYPDLTEEQIDFYMASKPT